MTCHLCNLPLDFATQDTRFDKKGNSVHTDCAETLVFVYGTLREGQPLEHQLTVLDRERATLSGAALYVARHDGYPVLVLGSDGVVVGDLCTVDRTDKYAMDRLRSVTNMEINAGYTYMQVTVSTALGYRHAACFVWTRPTTDMHRVHDDWKAYRHSQNGGARYAIAHPEGRKGWIHLVRIDAEGAEQVVWEGASYSKLARWCRKRNITVSVRTA